MDEIYLRLLLVEKSSPYYYIRSLILQRGREGVERVWWSNFTEVKGLHIKQE